MPGIPSSLYNRLRQTLLRCGPFDNDNQLQALFIHELLFPWRDRLPQTNSREDRVNATMQFLVDKRRADIDTSVLVLFLGVLRERFEPEDDCFTQLTNLAQELDRALQRPVSTSQQRYSPEANPGNQQMIFTEVWLKLLEHIQAVARVSVPKIVHGERKGQASTGTGWLIAPHLALTCYHVIQARSLLDQPIHIDDLHAQVTNSLFMFDYTSAGKGVEYRVLALECFDPTLDYALLRLEDRPDFPLSKRGFLRLDAHAPLTVQTSLYIIQHPKGQPQQNASGGFEKFKENRPDCILHNAPTEVGTSGAPVLNVTNWGVVALHTGEDEQEHLRVATLLKAILPHIQQKRPDVYATIAALS